MITIRNTLAESHSSSRPPFLYPASATIEGEKEFLIEIGPGRGDFLFHLATEHPQACVVGIEIKSLRMDKLVARTEKRKLKNIVLIQANARDIIGNFFQKDQAKQIHIHFPDPWSKRKHAKHRLITRAFLAQCALILKPQGVLHFTTDVQEYAETVATLLQTTECFVSRFPTQISTERADAYPTLFSERWKKAGRTIYYQLWSRL